MGDSCELCWLETTKDVVFLPLQRLRHYYPLELPADDAGVEERCVFGSRQYLSAQASTGEMQGARGMISFSPIHLKTETHICKHDVFKHKQACIL